MTEYVKLYIGPKEDMQGSDENFIHRARLISAKPKRAPAGIAKYSDVKLTLKSRPDDGEGSKYDIDIDSRTVRNWYNRFDDMVEEEIENNPERYEHYSDNKDKNAMIVEVLSNLLPFWINTRKAEKV